MKVVFIYKDGSKRLVCDMPDEWLDTLDGKETIRLSVEKALSPEPSYGPLTVEMVAEAMYEASHSHTEGTYRANSECWRREARNQARFVLRLLKNADLLMGARDADEQWTRDWLLSLAKEQ